MHTDKYWFEDLNLIFSERHIQDIIPKPNTTYQQKINSIVRLSLIIGLILSLYNYNGNYMFIPVVIMSATYVLYLFRLDEYEKAIKSIKPNAQFKDLPSDLKEKFTNYLSSNKLKAVKCAKSDVSNPFMNPLPFDNREREPVCNVLDECVQKKIDDNYDINLFKDGSDIFSKNNGNRQFYTMPSTSYPNNQHIFANWLYRTPTTCKEGNGNQCVANNHTPLYNIKDSYYNYIK